MRKRGKKRIPQEVKSWFRVNEVDKTELFALPTKKVSRWKSGRRRDWNTRILNTSDKSEVTTIIRSTIKENLLGGTRSLNLRYKNFYKNLSNSKTQSLTKYKNFCLGSGRGRTYNRNLYLARHNLRKLIGIGVISGLVK